MNAKREKRGPYAASPSYKAPHRVTLDDTTADKLRTLGNGNLSANNLAHADTLADYQVGPVAVVVPSNTAERELRTPAGRRVVVCPATYRDDVSCATCELCQKSSAARAIVAFPSHGSKFKTIDIVVSK